LDCYIKNRRKAGSVRFIAEVAQIEASSTGESESLFNAGIGVDFYFPQGFILIGEASRNFSGSDESISNNNFTIAGGYSFTPRLFKYFSLVDAYLGYRIVNYDLEGLELLGVKSLAYKGPYIGARVEVPFYRKFSALVGLNIYPFDKVKNDDPQKLFGEADASRAVELNLVAKYRIIKEGQIFLDYKKIIYKSNFNNDVEDVSVNINSDLIRVGFALDF